MARILIVDDASFMRGSLKYSVEKDGHTVAGLAKDGVEAIEMYKKLKPDLVTMDILMKGMDGITALKNIRKSDPKAKVVMVTAMGLEEKEKEARDLGASGYIRKPFKHNEIMDTLKKVLG
jgi:two-component system chemotaxis response regulator CheY